MKGRSVLSIQTRLDLSPPEDSVFFGSMGVFNLFFSPSRQVITEKITELEALGYHPLSQCPSGIILWKILEEEESRVVEFFLLFLEGTKGPQRMVDPSEYLRMVSMLVLFFLESRDDLIVPTEEKAQMLGVFVPTIYWGSLNWYRTKTQ
jgi:hypothetical protein